MHFPITISLFSQDVLLHTILEWLSYFIGFRYYLYLRKNNQDLISSSNRSYIFIAALLGGLIGSRLIGGLENLDSLHKNNHQILLYFFSNKTVLGGFLFATWTVEIFKYFLKEKNSSGDMMTYPILLALIIGRIGCFSMGIYEETYGTPFKYGINLGDGIPRHPVTLYEIVFLVFIWISSKKIFNNKLIANGSLYKYFFINYLLFRFILDFIKPHFNLFLNLSTIQIICLLGLAYYLRSIKIWLIKFKKISTNTESL